MNPSLASLLADGIYVGGGVIFIILLIIVLWLLFARR